MFADCLCRALMLWGGNRKRLCFETWRQWAALKQGRRQALRQALNHWQHLYLSQALMGWRYHTQRAQVFALCACWRWQHHSRVVLCMQLLTCILLVASLM
jgi:hypothetical protein